MVLVQEDDWIVSKNLKELKIWSEGVLILSIERSGEFWGVPARDITILENDLIILYGRVSAIINLDNRKAGKQGDKEHHQSKRIQDKVIDQQLDMAVADEDKDKIH